MQQFLYKRSYWSITWSFYNESFSAIMSGRTFEQLIKFFYLSDAEKQPNHTRLTMIRFTR